MKQTIQCQWSSVQKNYKKRNINSNLVPFPVDSDIDQQNTPQENHNHNKKIKKTVVHTIPSDTDSDEEAAKQTAIISSLRTLAHEKDRKQKSVVTSYTTLTLVPSLQSRKLEAGSTSSLPTCVVCHDVITHDSMVCINPCSHLSCSSCISRYIGKKVNLDIRNVVCPEEKCGKFLRKSFIDKWAPKEVRERLRNAMIEVSVLQYTFRLTCPFEGCGRKIVDDERGYKIRACTRCWRLFCYKCSEGWHMGMTCKQFMRREEEAKWRREMIVWRRQEEEREKKLGKKDVIISKGDDLLLY